MEQCWIMKKQQWLVLVCLLSGFTIFLKSVIAEDPAQLLPIPSRKKMEHHDPQNFQLAYADDQIALFFEPAARKIISKLVFTPVAESEAWKFNYSNSTRKSSPVIYFIKHKPRSNNVNHSQRPRLSSTPISNFQHDITTFKSTELPLTSPSVVDAQHYASKKQKFQKEVDGVTDFITNTYEQEIQSVLKWSILDILVYDNLTQVGNTETAQGLLQEAISKTADINRGFMFFEWYLPIYTRHGGSVSITNFMNLLNLYTNQDNSNYYLGNETLNIGEFVHIWSEATATDLRYLVHTSSRWRWSSTSSNNFEIAQKRFMTFKYSGAIFKLNTFNTFVFVTSFDFSSTKLKLLLKRITDTFQNLSWPKPPTFWKTNWYNDKSNVTFRHFDEYVAYYYDETMLPLHDKWPYQFLADSWRYVRNTYGILDPHSILHMVFHDKYIMDLCENRYLEKTFDYRIIIDCLSLNDYTHYAYTWDKKQYMEKYLLRAVGYNIVLQMIRTGNLPAALIKKNSFDEQNILLNIFVYDIYLGIGMKAEADQWWYNKEQEFSDYTRWDTLLFHNWFSPIYIAFNQTKPLKNFLKLFFMNWPQDGRTKKEMNAGEFVHFWSGAVGEDLTSLAMERLRWTTKYNEELLQARSDYPQVKYLNTTLNLRTQQWWNIDWIHYVGATYLVYSDNQIAFYFDYEINVSMSWPCKLMSDSWKYAKKQYGPFGPDPFLNIILHRKTSVCSALKPKSYIDAHYNNRNVIDCGIKSADDNIWKDSFESKNVLLEQLAKLILCNAREPLAKWLGLESADLRWSMVPILVYDIYKGLGMIEDAKRWRDDMFKKNEIIPYENSFWFRDWYYPIYQKYGEALALNCFLYVVYANYQTKDWKTAREYNMGEMVHFWSSAVEENLWPLADKAFGCCSWDQKTYLTAQKEFLNLNYTDKTNNSTVMIPSEKWIDSEGKVTRSLSLVYVDQQFAAYVDLGVDLSIAWPFESISMAWRYAKKTYGQIEPGAILHLLILSTDNNVCRKSGRLSYGAKKSEHRTILTCDGFVKSWEPKDRLRILHVLSEIVLNEAHQTVTWPSFFVSENSLTKIIAYDIIYEIGNSLEAMTTLKEDINYYTNTGDNKTYWIRDWFYPMYANYGKANVLNNFLNLLSKHWHKVPKGLGYDYAEFLNVGEFVHFWSGAAGVNLIYLAKQTLPWNYVYITELEEARKSFPMLTYSNAEYKDESNSAKIVLTENQFEHSELLFKAYGSSFISIYFDADVNRAIEWPFNIISQTWAYIKSNYGTVYITIVPHLNIFLHGKKHVGCKVSLKLQNNTKQENILDCGKAPSGSNAWMKSNLEDMHDLTYGFAKLIQHSAQQTEGREAYDPKLFSQILAFDIFLRLGNFKHAHRLLQEMYEENKIKSRRKQFSIQNWYLPLYTKYGGVNLLSNFVTLLSTTWVQQETQDAHQKMNVGQNIHFWSASAEENLNAFAEHIFGKNQLHQAQFSEAIKEFPQLCLSRYNCELDVFGIQKTENRSLIIEVSVLVGFACILFAAILIPLVIYRNKFKRLQHEMRELTAEEIKEFFEGSNQADGGDGNFSIESKPFNMDYEIPRESLDIDFDSALGSGEFGLVYRGLLKPSSKQKEQLIGNVVAVKTVKPNVNVTHFKTILTELKVMGYLGSHANIVSLLGAYTVNIKNREVYMALEFCSRGDLLSFLKLNRTNFEDWIAKIAEPTDIESKFEAVTSLGDTGPAKVVAPNSKLCLEVQQDVEKATTFTTNVELQTETRNSGVNLTGNAFSTFELLKWSSEIASGMDFIASKNVIHGDLAARNVLLTEKNVSKISDFGLSRQLENYAYYMKTSKTPVPWRWMAIESLRDMKFSVQSDAWSFGVVLYEMFSLGTMPYAGWAWDCELVDKLVAGKRLSAPEFGNEGVYKLMLDCMQKEPPQRLTFSQVMRKSKLKFARNGNLIQTPST